MPCFFVRGQRFANAWHGLLAWFLVVVGVDRLLFGCLSQIEHLAQVRNCSPRLHRWRRALMYASPLRCSISRLIFICRFLRSLCFVAVSRFLAAICRCSYVCCFVLVLHSAY